MILGKALGGGYYPVSATLASAKLMDLLQPGDHGSTFGGNPLACAVGLASLDVVVSENLPARARAAGTTLMRELRAIDAPVIREVRGRGLLIGIELAAPAKLLSEALLERGVAAKEARDHVLRLAPPLIIEEDEIAYLLERFTEAVATVTPQP